MPQLFAAALKKTSQVHSFSVYMYVESIGEFMLQKSISRKTMLLELNTTFYVCFNVAPDFHLCFFMLCMCYVSFSSVGFVNVLWDLNYF